MYKNEHVRDSIEHWTDPAYVQIKPNYRASKPVANSNMQRVKNTYSFKAWGDQFSPSESQNVFRSTMRQTMQVDSPYFRGVDLQAADAKHAIADPSHTFFSPPARRKSRNIYCINRDKEETSIER